MITRTGLHTRKGAEQLNNFFQHSACKSGTVGRLIREEVGSESINDGVELGLGVVVPRLKRTAPMPISSGTPMAASSGKSSPRPA
jgi:hypothetical protein